MKKLLPDTEYFMTLEEIAELEGVSFQMIQQIVSRAVMKLRRIIKKRNLLIIKGA